MNQKLFVRSIVAAIAIVAIIAVVGCASASSPSVPKMPTRTPTPIPQPAVLKDLKLGDWVIVTGTGGAVSLDCYGLRGLLKDFGNPNEYYNTCEGFYVPTVPKIGEVAKITLDNDEGKWRDGEAIYACAITCGWFPIGSLGVGVTPTPTLLELFPPTTETPIPAPTLTAVPRRDTPLPRPIKDNCFTYKVVSGDTLTDIVTRRYSKYNLVMTEVISDNPGIVPDYLTVGQTIQICPR